MTADPLDAAHKLLAQIHAQTLHEEKRLELMHSKGLDHFHPGLQKAVEGMTEHDLDNFVREAGALAAMQEGRRKS